LRKTLFQNALGSTDLRDNRVPILADTDVHENYAQLSGGNRERLAFLKVHTAYPEYLDAFYADRPELWSASFNEQQKALKRDGFFWYGYFANALASFGYDAQELVWNSRPLQSAWGRENGMGDMDGAQLDSAQLEEICLAQIEEIKPEIVLLHHWNDRFLTKMRQRVDNIKLVVGWVGSSMPDDFVPFFHNVDVLLSCAPESVAAASRFRGNVYHLNHWFASSASADLEKRPKQFDICFSGCLNPGAEHHGERIALLDRLASSYDFALFSSDKTDCPALERLRRPAVFGRTMLQALRDSRVVLNMHADSSPIFASNLRMFEATGVGSCLLTDWKENLGELFTPGVEVAVFKDPDDCLEKVEYLLNDSTAREAIAQAGQTRCLNAHDDKARMGEFDRIIREALDRSS
jgi:hypothetical protein